MSSNPEEYDQTVEGIARAVSIIVSTRVDRLSSVTVAGSAGLVRGVEQRLRVCLAEVGLDAVDVRIVACGGALRLDGTEFEPW